MPPRASNPVRALALLGGLALLALAAAVTFGFALAAPVGMLIAAVVLHKRKRRYSRGSGWVGAVVATSLALGVASSLALRRVPPGTFEKVRRQAIGERQRHPPHVPRVLQRIAPPSPATPLIQAKTDSLTATPGVFWTLTIMGALIACGIMGAIVGSAGWACATIAAFGILGRWPGARRAPPADDADYAAALTG
ncbi:MAG TPA: hypothetical protein VFS44_12090 [Gemmatimonadaceae bacterium]|nr:hypothetical protein [Gemmatimonadaceae bacterium]